MSGVLRTLRERASRQPACRLRRAAARVASSVPGFLRLLPARAAPLVLLLAALAVAQPATAQTVVDLIANDGQTSADADAAAYGTNYATSFTTGSHSTGYELTRVTMWLKKDGMESRPGNSVNVYIYTDAAGTPGVLLGSGQITDEPTTSWAGYGVGIRINPIVTTPVGIDLAANTKYWVVAAPTSNQGADDDHYFLGGTSSDNENSGGLSGWSLGNDRLLRASGGSWDASNTNANALRLELRGSTRAAANLPSAPTGLTVSEGTVSGSLDVRWTKPSGTIVDYDLRYYEGSTDPTDAADWIEEGEAGGPPDPSAASAATITGLKAGTAYQVQVRAASVDGEGAWSASVAATTGAPASAPTGLSVSAGTNSGELDASWTAPSGTVTDYDLRYYEGSADPTDAAEWVEEHETDGLGTGDSTAVSATIKGLKASTAYRVQVRAGNAVGEGPWSASVAGTTGSPPGTNRAPKVMVASGQSANVCKLWTDTSQPAVTNIAVAGILTTMILTTRGTETTEWPTSCTQPGNAHWPVFDDRDAEDLYYTLSYTTNNVRGFGGRAPFSVGTADGAGKLTASAVAIGSDTNVRIDLTARDKHGASASTWVRFTVKAMANAAGAPAFSAQVADQTADTGTAFSLALPAATGGDVSISGRAINSPYTYAVSGLPAGLSFDAATRAVSGTPTANGTYTVTYTADDADADYSRKGSPGPADTADAASQTFTIQVGEPPPAAPTGLTVSAGTASGSLDVNWTAPSGTVTDYDLRYYAGTADPTDDADWVEEGEAGSPPDPGTSTSATIAGLKANTAYRVQVRAGNADAEGAWSASASATTAADSTAPVLRSARLNSAGTHLILTYDEALDTTSAPYHRTFALFLAGTRRNIPNNDLTGGDLPVTVDGSTVTLELGSPALTAGQAVAVTYDAAGAANDNKTIRDLAGNNAAGLSKQPVTNILGDSTAPALSLAEVNGSTLTLYYNENLDLASIPATTDFSVSVAGAARTPTHVAVSDGLVTLTLAPRVRLREDAVTVTYTVPGTNPIADLAGNKAPALTGHAVTNNTHELGLRVRTGNGSGSLSASWTAPSGVTITDYDLRYYAGSADPTDAADWVEEHETTGLKAADSTATSATITGLKAGTAYRVQVRAATADGEGAWTASVSGTTGTASGTNHAPKAMTASGQSANACKLWTDTSQPADTLGNIVAGSRAPLVLTTRGAETTDWPTSCTSGGRSAPVTLAGPQPQSASVAGTKLKIVFDEALDDTSTESGQHFTVVMSDRDGDQRTIAGTEANVAISGSTVTVTLAEAVPPNATAQVTYEPPTLSLKAADDNTRVASFLGFKIETVYDTAVPELKQAAVVQTSKNPDGLLAVIAFVGRLAPVGHRSAGRIRAGTSPAVRRIAVAGFIFVRLRQPVVGFLDADAVPGLGVGRQGEARVPQQAVGDQLRGALPAFRVSFAPPRVVLERAGQHHARDRGLDDMGVGLRDPLRRIADLPPVACQRLPAGVGADRQAERQAAEEGLLSQQRGHAAADPLRRFRAHADCHHAASRAGSAETSAAGAKYPANRSASASASRLTRARATGSKLFDGLSASGSTPAIFSFTCSQSWASSPSPKMLSRGTTSTRSRMLPIIESRNTSGLPSSSSCNRSETRSTASPRRR